MLKPKRSVFWSLSLALVLVLVLVFAASCGDPGSGQTTVSAPDTTATVGDTTATTGDQSATSAGDAVLEVTGPEGTKSYTLAQLEALQSTEGFGGMKSSTGHITPPTEVKGVLLEDLFVEVGGCPADMAISIAAKDGYEMTVSRAQLDTGDFLTYDMVTGAESTVEGPLDMIVAYEYDGRPLDPESEGTLRLAIVGSKKEQVTDGHWWVKWVTKVQVKPIEQEWSIALSGALSEEIDRATFESCSAQGCHGQVWTDAEGTEWTGVPLYLLAGRVDDEVAHSGPAYNRDLANAGYEVEIDTAGGQSVKVQSKTMYYNKSLLVACKANGATLSEEFWPLRLVGEGVDPAGMLGQITEIKALVPGQ